MAISFPLIPPGSPTTADIRITPNNIVGENQSPFTGSQQIFEYTGEWWEAEIALPPMSRADAAAWTALLASLRGKSGSFILGDPAAQIPRGAANAYNLLLQAIAIDNAVWIRNQNTVTATNIVDPNSVADARELTPTGGATDSYAIQYAQIAPLKSYTVAVWLKLPSGTKTISIFAVAQGSDAFQAVTRSCNLTTAWQQFTVQITPTAGNTYAGLQIGGGGTWTTGAIQIWLGELYLTGSTIVLGDPGAGVRVSGGSQTGKSLVTGGWFPSQTGALLKGDYIGLAQPPIGGPVGTPRLHQVLTDVNSDGSGTATLDLFPRLRESPANQAQVFFMNCKGTFRLAENLRSYQIGNDLLYKGITLRCKEAI